MAAALRVDLKRQRQITELGERLHHISSKLIPKAELVIDPGSRSQYVGLRSRDQYPLPIKGFHIQLDLSIENKGNRMSSIKRFGLALGMDGDLVVLGADPAQDATAFSKVRYTILGGKVIYSEK
jgi:hypothetical protein